MSRLKRKLILHLLLILLIICCLYQSLFLAKISPISLTSIHRNLPFRKISIAHYTTLYGIRTDSHSKIFNENLNSICQILDPEDYPLADSVFVSLVDLIHLPRTISYRRLHPRQLWIVHTEESPRNSYRTIEMKDRNELDQWFNLTSTLKPQSDFHIQYRGYRIKPSIGDLLQKKFNITLNHPMHFSSDMILNGSSIYLNTLSSIFEKELIYRANILSQICPYTCNQPLSADFLAILQPYLKPIETKILDRTIVYIAWFVSNCNTHSRREDYVKQLRTQPGIHIDIYGHCQSIFHPHIISTPCQKGTPNCTEKILSNYRFYLSFENSLCDFYITEKYWIQGLNQHAIPIVFGAKREQYQQLAIPNSYIHVDDYPTFEALAQELHRLNRNDTDYIRYLQWTQLYDVSAQYNSTPAMDMHSALCFLGHYRYLHSMKETTIQIQSLMRTIRQIFNLTNMHLPNFNWTTAQTHLIRLSQFYHPKINCWDHDYPSQLKQIYDYFFTWWKLF